MPIGRVEKPAYHLPGILFNSEKKTLCIPVKVNRSFLESQKTMNTYFKREKDLCSVCMSGQQMLVLQVGQTVFLSI